MQHTTLTLGPLETNCYIAWCPHTKEAVIIDPADSGSSINEKILELGLKPVAIILTHGHFDHVLGLLEVKTSFPVPILVNEKDLFLLKQAQKSALHWLKRNVDPVPPPDKFFKEGDVVEFGKCQLKIIETPGHTPGSVSLFSAEEGDKNQPPTLFSGDTLFKNGIGRTDFSYSNHEQIVESLTRLKELPPKTRVFPGHGESTTIQGERLV